METDCHVDLQTGFPSPPTPSPREFGESLIRKKRCAGRIPGERGAFFRERIRYGVALRDAQALMPDELPTFRHYGTRKRYHKLFALRVRFF